MVLAGRLRAVLGACGAVVGGHGADRRHAFAALNLTAVMAEHSGWGRRAVVQGGLDLLVVQRVADANVHRPSASVGVDGACLGLRFTESANRCQSLK